MSIPLGMEPALRFSLLLLRKLVSFFLRRWSQSTRWLWCIFSLVRSRLSSRRPKKGDEIRRSTRSRPANPTTAICASQLPSTVTSIVGGDNPVVAFPTPIILIDQTRKPTIPGPTAPLNEIEEQYSTDHLGVDGYYLEGSGTISRSHDSAGHHDEHGYTNTVLPQGREDPHGSPSSRLSSPPLSARSPSITGSIISQTDRTPKSTTRARRPLPTRDASQRRGRSPTPTSAHQSVDEVPALPQTKSLISVSIHRGPCSAAASFGPTLPQGKLRPMIGINRYEKHKMVVVEGFVHCHVSPPVTTQFVRGSTPNKWVPHMHPEGALYWAHETDKIYTDTNMCDPDLRWKIEQAVEEIRELRAISPPLPDDWELALELGTDDDTGEAICSYYFVCHSTRCLFWLHHFNLGGVLEGLRGVTEETHIHLALQAQYWSHWEMFPHNRDVPEHLVQELTGILLHAGIDCMTSPNSTAIYSEVELNKLLNYVKEIRQVGRKHGFSACVVGRLMTFFVHSRYLHFYGQRGARLTSDQTIYGSHPKRTFLINILSILFFYAPEPYLRGMESVYTDFIVSQHRWVQFIRSVRSDWTESILYGTVLLTANVAFLAIPDVGTGGDTRTLTQIFSYISIVTSLGCLVTGLILIRHHKTRPQDAAEEVDNYLQTRHHHALGFETLAVIYSLPYSLLLWATIAFTIAFSLETLLFSNELSTKISVGITLVMVTLLIFWCILVTLEAGTDFSVLETVHVLKGRLVEFTRSLWGKTSEPGLDMGDAGGDDGWAPDGIFNRTGTLKKAFDRLRRPRRPRASDMFVDPTERAPSVTTLEMGDGVSK